MPDVLHCSAMHYVSMIGRRLGGPIQVTFTTELRELPALLDTHPWVPLAPEPELLTSPPGQHGPPHAINLAAETRSPATTTRTMPVAQTSRPRAPDPCPHTRRRAPLRADNVPRFALD
ncbi:hypothetical protein BJV78DRAFT_1279112 [Lactifluus subvellereus]|nr:hypothetical protein BJV78DRAFT_1279112 [Lactifluus subvellereus]